LALVGVLAAVNTASTCENQDYLAAPSLVLPTSKDQPPSSLEITHPYDALTTVDYVAYNTGDTQMRVKLTATTLRLDGNEADEGDTGTDDTGSTDTDAIIAGAADEAEFTISPGKRVPGRFSAVKLGTGVSSTLEAECFSDTCEGYVEWVIILGEVECRSNQDCAADEICDEISRTCVESSTAGCATISGVPTGLFLIPGLCWLIIRRRRRQGHPPSRRSGFTCGLVALAVAGTLSTAPATAHAQRAIFDQPTAQLSLGTGIKRFTGALGDLTKPGVSLEVVNAIQFRNLAFQMTVGTAYFLTDQGAPPLSKGLQTYSLKTGPRFSLPLWVFQIYAEVEYERFGLISNSLVTTTGNRLGYHAAGGGGGLRWVPAPFFLDARTGYNEIFGLDGGMFSVGFSVGLIGAM
jgi:hypothetical protein